MRHYNFAITCFTCPEQYDVYDGDKLIAYVRYRYGHLTVNPYFKELKRHFDLYSAETIYRKEIDFDTDIYSENIGDSWGGSFDDDKREEILDKLDNIIYNYFNNEKETSI